MVLILLGESFVPFMRADLSHFTFFFFNDTATTEIYTLSLHDALPISLSYSPPHQYTRAAQTITRRLFGRVWGRRPRNRDRKSTRLNSSHGYISYAVFCLKKKKKDKLPVNTYRDVHMNSSSALSTVILQ